MNKSMLVFRNQFAQFKLEKGMMFFYGLSIAMMGIIVPIFMRGVASALTMAALLTAIFLKPILSESLAGEREHRTLETLLSSPMNGKSIIWGKFQFCLFFSVCFFGLTALCAALTNWLTGDETALTVWQWIGIILLALFNFSAISIAGVHTSAKSGDMRVANSRVSLITYPLGLIFIVYLSVVVIVDFFPAVIISFVFMFIYLCVILTYAVKIAKMKQSDYYEHIKIKKNKNALESQTSFVTPKSQFGIVFRFELKYLATLSMLLKSFGKLCCAPAIVCSLTCFTGKLDFNYAVFITLLMIPRVPTNLIAYSIGGEKVYRTGESLLSTPLHIRSVFLAKCMIPVSVSAVMLIVSSLFTLMGATIAGWLMPDMAPIHGYNAGQLVLLFPVGIMSSMLMMFISAILSVTSKTPRHGLYVTSIISFLFVVPVLAIVYLTNNILTWSVIYSVVLLIGNAICIGSISDKITRPQIMSRL